MLTPDQRSTRSAEPRAGCLFISQKRCKEGGKVQNRRVFSLESKKHALHLTNPRRRLALFGHTGQLLCNLVNKTKRPEPAQGILCYAIISKKCEKFDDLSKIENLKWKKSLKKEQI